MQIRRDFPHAVREIENAWIPMTDGTRLACRIWLPTGAEADPVPVVLEYVPYRKDDWTAHQDSTRHPYFAGSGYAAVRVDIRGSGDSDGILAGEYLPQEQDDALEVIAWLEAQPWCDGRVGMIGYSWGGFSALQVAARRPPQLKAIITVDSTDDRYLDDCHYMGGCLLGSDMLKWASTMLAYAAMPPDPRFVGDQWREIWMSRLSETPAFSEDWIAHQRRDDFWKHGSVAEDYAAIDCPVFAVGGWADAYVNAVFRLLTNLNVPRRAIVGPWAHMIPTPGIPGPSVGFLQECVRWWDRWLKGIDNGVDAEPMLLAWLQDYVEPSRTHSERPGHWVAEPTWPGTDTGVVAYRLSEDGALEARDVSAKMPASEPDLPAATEATVRATEPGTIFVVGAQTCGAQAGAWCPSGAGDDLPGDQREDDSLSLVFDTAALSEPLEVLGLPELCLTVESSEPRALISARLEDVAPNGASLLVSWGLLNLTHRERHEEPVALEPGREYAVELTLRACGHRFPAGHRIRLALSPTYWPHAWPSPRSATLGIIVDGASSLALPVRHPLPFDDELELGSVETAPQLDAGDLATDTGDRRVSTDDVTGRHEIVERAAHVRAIPPTGEILREASIDAYSIAEDDPLSARVECEREISIERADWSWLVRTHSEMTCDAETFYVANTVTAFLDGTEIFASTRTHKAPRDLL